MNTEHWLSKMRRRSAGLAAALLAPAMLFAVPLGAVAQEQFQALTLRSYPLAIHQGTCETVVAEPSYDLGFLVPRALYVQQGDEAVADEAAYDTGAFEPFGFGAFYGYGEADAFGEEGAVSEEGAVGEEGGLGEGEAQNELIGEESEFLFDDVDGDGYYDYGLDLNRDGLLDQAEIVERPILWTYESDLDDIKAGTAGDAEDAELEDLRATPHVLIVHRERAIGTDYLACGEIQGAVDDEGKMAFALRPLTSNSFVGIAEMQEGETGFLGIGGDSGEVEAWVIPSRVSQVVGQPPSAGATATTDNAQADAAQQIELVAEETGFQPATLSAPAGEVTLAVENPLDVERTFLIPDLGIEQTLAPGERTEVTVEATEPGTYPFMIEGENELTGELEIAE